MYSFHVAGESGDKVTHAVTGPQPHLVGSPHHRCSCLLFLVPEAHVKKFNGELILRCSIFSMYLSCKIYTSC